MGSNRRHRAKEEGTFLESVKKQLENVSGEIAQIKSAITELKPLYSGRSQFDWCQHSCNTLSNAGPWHTWGVSEWGNSQNYVSTAAEMVISYSRADAPAFKPQCSPITAGKTELLRYRHLSGDSSRPQELMHLKVEHTFVEAPVRLWGRRRPNARTRRRRRAEQLMQTQSSSTLTSVVPRQDTDLPVCSGEVLREMAAEQARPEHDDHEMILPMITASFSTQTASTYQFFDGGSSWRAKLVREPFASHLPANPALIGLIDNNIEMGSAYRDDASIPLEAKSAFVLRFPEQARHECTDPAPCESEEVRHWGTEEIKIWMQATIRLANKAALDCNERGVSARMNVIQNRWDASCHHLPQDLRKDLWAMLEESFEPLAKFA